MKSLLLGKMTQIHDQVRKGVKYMNALNANPGKCALSLNRLQYLMIILFTSSWSLELQ